MMDAGTALFESKDGYGSVLGQIKAELKEFGVLSTPEDFPTEAMPPSTAEYDLFLDYSTCWRNRYISCRIEDAGDTGRTTDIGEPIRRYAISFKEGNRSTGFRILIHVLIMAALLAGVILSGQWYLTLLAVLLGLLTFYQLLVPSKKAQHTVQLLIQKVSRYGKGRF